MTRGILRGGLLGGLAMFAWGAVSHVVLGIGGAGLRGLPGEATVVPALQAAIHEPGLYFIPAFDETPGKTEEQQAAAEKVFEDKLRAGPRGLLVYHPDGAESVSASQLLFELLSNVGCALVAGFLLARGGPRLGAYGSRVLFVALLGVASWLSVEASYWNWYGFPPAYSVAQLVDQVVGFAIAGFAVAGFVRPSAP